MEKVNVTKNKREDFEQKLGLKNNQWKEKEKEDQFTMSRMERFLNKLDKQLEESLK